ncbi:MAG: methionine--tRNA ligase [Candidatus Nealsonbacteria bacterium]|nr:methionine--tRNA ligase [Candidatus Nealsonbacteria bacterium]
MARKKFYITTSIAYVNALPHLGYALEIVQADVLARYHRILGEDVFFLTGTDEHGAKVVKAAEQAGKIPEDFTDMVSEKFRELTRIFNLSNDYFIRTTDREKHWSKVQGVWLKLLENGDIYKKKYKGLYCVGCEAFITKKDLIDGRCRIHLKEPEVVEEENYFFRLSKYSKNIEEILKKDKIKIIPASRKNEMLSFLKDGLEDISFSRPRKDLKWGIPVSDDETQTIYVWADALINYLSGAPGRWPADVQCIGKDIQKFHSLIWPGMLLSLGLALPKTIFVHGFITVAGQKMSKSLGNVVDPFELIKKYGTDAVRYFLLREIPPTEDGDFTQEKFEGRYNADLASGLGNLVARVITMAAKLEIKNSKTKITNKNLKSLINKTQKECYSFLDGFEFNEALMAIWEIISWCDKYIEKERPWVESKNQKEVIGNLLFAVGEIAKLLEPFLPKTSEKILEQLKTQKSQPLFPRI